MYAAIAAYITTNITTAIKRQAVIYSIYAVGALLFIFAGGYLVNALHILAMYRFGGVTASLIIAGSFLVFAAGMFAVAYGISRRAARRAPNAGERLYSTPPHYSRGTVALAAGALTATLVTAFAAIRRSREPVENHQKTDDQQQS